MTGTNKLLDEIDGLKADVRDRDARIAELEAALEDAETRAAADRDQCDRMTSEAGAMAQELARVERERDEHRGLLSDLAAILGKPRTTAASPQCMRQAAERVQADLARVRGAVVAIAEDCEQRASHTYTEREAYGRGLAMAYGNAAEWIRAALAPREEPADGSLPGPEEAVVTDRIREIARRVRPYVLAGDRHGTEPRIGCTRDAGHEGPHRSGALEWPPAPPAGDALREAEERERELLDAILETAPEGYDGDESENYLAIQWLKRERAAQPAPPAGAVAALITAVRDAEPVECDGRWSTCSLCGEFGDAPHYPDCPLPDALAAADAIERAALAAQPAQEAAPESPCKPRGAQCLTHPQCEHTTRAITALREQLAAIADRAEWCGQRGEIAPELMEAEIRAARAVAGEPRALYAELEAKIAELRAALARLDEEGGGA